ncbi:MAG: HEAT repeat domain-containing protein [Deltaproteobacteria bacterium]|nr:HEAT repeat domain-containing protein [Deltaproteobacteria bacterium]
MIRLTRFSAVAAALWLTLAVAGSGHGAEPTGPLATLTGHKDPLRREAAALALGVRGDRAALPALLQQLAKDPNPWVRARCAEALGLIGDGDAIRPLRAALAQEKVERVRRILAEALVRLGQRTGLEELMWQLKAGTNHARAEAMAFLVRLFGEPLGQDEAAWWTHLAESGYRFLSQRPRGSPAVGQLRGALGESGKTRHGPWLAGAKVAAWKVVPAVVLNLGPLVGPVGLKELQALEQRTGPIPDGALLLLRTAHRQTTAAPGKTPSARAPAPPDARLAGTSRGPGLTEEGARYLLKRAPRLLGVAIDAPTLDLPTTSGRPARTLLLAAGRLVLESLDDMDRLPPVGARLILVAPSGASPPAPALVLALYP